MRKLIQGVLPFPVDAQSNLFFCALASVFLRMGPYHEDTPFFCGPKQDYCLNCGDCGDKTNLAKYHLRLYHHYLTITGVGLMWGDTARRDTYDQSSRRNALPSRLEDRLDFAMQAAGYEYLSMHPETGRQEAFARIARSIDRGTPVLMKLGDAADWCVVTGYDDENAMLYGLDASRHYLCQPAVKPDGYTEDGLFYSRTWYEHMTRAVVITAQSGTGLRLHDLLMRMIGQLSSLGNGELPAKVGSLLEHVNPDNAQESAEYLNELAGYAVEARWHAAECFNPTLAGFTQDELCRDMLYRCCDRYLNTHDECWKIWAVLGVSPQSGYRVPPDAGRTLLGEAKIEQLKLLFATVFDNDRTVLALLRECANRLASERDSPLTLDAIHVGRGGSSERRA